MKKIDIFMKDGDEYIGMDVIDGATNVQENRLVVCHPVDNSWLVVNSQDIRKVYIYDEQVTDTSLNNLDSLVKQITELSMNLGCRLEE